MTESQLTMAILSALRESGRGMFFRNNTGKLQDRTGRWVQFGLGVGSPDIVGILRPSGRFVAIEVKVEAGRTSGEQLAWQQAAQLSGALCVIVRSVAQAMALVEQAT